MENKISQINLFDIEIFIDLASIKSIRELARRRNLQAGQLSKMIKKLENKVGSRLIERSLSGIILTRQGQEFLKCSEKMIKMVDEIHEINSDLNTKKNKNLYSIGAPTFLSSHLTAVVASGFKNTPNNSSNNSSINSSNNSENSNETRFRILDFSPDQITSAGLRGAFDMALHIGKLDWPRSWESVQVGQLRWGLFANKKHPLNLQKPITLAKILKYPFLVPVYWTNEGLFVGHDQCPIPFSKRIRGFETATADAALMIAKNTQQLVFVPEVLANSHVLIKDLVQIPTPFWENVERPLYISVRTDAVSQRMFKEFKEQIAKLI